MKKIQMLFLLAFSLLQAELHTTAIDQTQFELFFDRTVVCDDKGILGLNNNGQILFREDEALIVFDYKTEKRVSLADTVDPDLFIYCPPKSRCLSDRGEVIGMVDQSVVLWSPSGELQTFPLPEELIKNHWTKVQRLEFVGEKTILLGLGSSHSAERKYYLLEEGEFLYLNQYIQENCFPETELSDLKISHLRFNSKGQFAGLVEKGELRTQETVGIFFWDGSTTAHLALKDFVKREGYIPESLDVFSLSEEGDVTVYFSDYKSIYIDYTTKKYMVWHTKEGSFEQILSAKDLGFGVLNGKGDGIFTKQSERHILFGGKVFQLETILSSCGLGEISQFDYYSFVNEKSEIVITTTEEGVKRPIILSISHIEE